jgi:diguanylate cyclase (GGDEF)-like protein
MNLINERKRMLNGLINFFMSIFTRTFYRYHSLTLRLISSFIIILLLIFSLGNVIYIQVAATQLNQKYTDQIATQRQQFAQDLAAQRQAFITNLTAQLTITAKAVQGILLNQISNIHEQSDDAEQEMINKFATCLTLPETTMTYQCLRGQSHHFALSSINLINHLMIKTIISLLCLHEGLVAVELLDWEDQLFDGYYVTATGELERLQQRFDPAGQKLHQLQQAVMDDDYLGQIIFHYHTHSLDALQIQYDNDIKQLIIYSQANFEATLDHLIHIRLLEGVLFFVLSLIAISFITFVTIIRPLKTLTHQARALAEGHFTQQHVITSDRGDELGILAQTFNSMSESLHQSYRALEQSNAQLEHKVAERTKELEEKNRQLEKLSTTDRLTQIYNRVKLEEIFDITIQQTRRYQHPFSVLIGDIDFFKQINDNYGHQVGDEVLVEIATLLRKTIRQTDSVGRWGGEEFLIILPNTDFDHALPLAQRICDQVAAHTVRSCPRSITMSLGLSCYHNDDDEDSIVERADKALYNAKRDGRNRVCYLLKQ